MRTVSAVAFTVFAALFAASVALAQTPGAVVAGEGSTGELEQLLRLATGVGWPGLVAWATWTLRGLANAGLTVTVRLSPEDRELLEGGFPVRRRA